MRDGEDSRGGANPRLTMSVEAAAARIDRTVAFMERHLNGNVTRDILAEVAGLNPEHYSRIFRKYKGTSPMEYLTGRRIEQAKHLLLNTALSVRSVARQVGFEDPYYFSRRFKQTVGVPPTAYAKRTGPRIAATDVSGFLRALGIEPLEAEASVPGAAEFAEEDADGRLTDAEAGRIEALRPDIIVTSRRTWQPQLAGIASTIVLDMNRDPIYEQLPWLARKLGREAEALSWTKAYEKQAEGLRKHAAAAAGGARVAVLRVRGELLQIYGMMNMGYPLYRSLGLAPPEKIGWLGLCNAYFHSSVITPAELAYYAAEHLFVVLQPDARAREAYDRLRALPAWRDFPAVRRGAVHHVDVKRWLPFDPLSIVMQMKEAAELLTARPSGS